MSQIHREEDVTMLDAIDSEGRLKSPEAAAELCSGLMETTAELISVLERETSLLKKRQTDDLRALHLKKNALTATLTQNLNILKTNADYIKMAVPEQVDDLKAQQRHFQKSLSANHDALSAMKAVSEQLVQVIVKKVEETKGGPQTYGKSANVAPARVHQPAAITLDTTL